MRKKLFISVLFIILSSYVLLGIGKTAKDKYDDPDLDMTELSNFINSAKAPNHGQKAYVSLFCNIFTKVEEDSSVETAFPVPSSHELDEIRVLAYTLQRSGTPYPLILLTTVNESSHPELWRSSLLPLQNLGVRLVPIKNNLGAAWKKHYKDLAETERSFRSRNAINGHSYQSIYNGLTDNQAWQYNKIHAWKLDMFDKIIFLDSDILIKRNIDNLFDEPEFSAVPLAGDSFNTGVLVLDPSKEVYARLLAEYTKSPAIAQGEQGFLNYFFRNSTGHHALPSIYNLNSRNKNYAIWPTLRKSASVWHYNGPVRPWDFYKASRPDWEGYYEPLVFYDWIQAKRQAYHSLSLDDVPADGRPWKNSRRVPALCDRFTPTYNIRRHSNMNKFSVLIGTWDRLDLLPAIISHYQISPLVSRIFVTWHNPASRPPPALLRLLESAGPGKAPVEFLYQKWDSLNNRFNPLDHLDTQAVLVCDDDIMVNITDIHFAFDTWKRNPNSLVGLFPRSHSYVEDEEGGQWLYHVSVRDAVPQYSYSMMLTKFMFMNADYLYLYSCLMPAAVHRYVDQALNCEDIAMNLLISGVSGTKNLAVLAPVVDFGTTSGISSKAGHLDSRSTCLTDLIKLMGINPLRSNIEVVQPYRLN